VNSGWPFPFVVGCDRSGTTLVRAMLDSHPALAVPSESYFPLDLLRRASEFERDGRVDIALLLADLRPRVRWQRWELPEDDVRARLTADAPSDIPDAIRSLYAAYANHAGKPRWADKTPKFVFAIRTLADAFPESRFVHVIRDGRDVALSRADAGWRLRNIGTEALRWCTHVEAGRAQGAALGDHRYYELRYEELVSDPESRMKEVAEFLDLDWDAQMLRYHERADEVVRSVGHPKLHGNIARPPTPGIRDWRRDLTASDIRGYDAVAGKTLERFGYERHSASTAPSDRMRAAVVRARWTLARGTRKVSGAGVAP